MRGGMLFVLLIASTAAAVEIRVSAPTREIPYQAVLLGGLATDGARSMLLWHQQRAGRWSRATATLIDEDGRPVATGPWIVPEATGSAAIAFDGRRYLAVTSPPRRPNRATFFSPDGDVLSDRELEFTLDASSSQHVVYDGRFIVAAGNRGWILDGEGRVTGEPLLFGGRVVAVASRPGLTFVVWQRGAVEWYWQFVRPDGALTAPQRVPVSADVGFRFAAASDGQDFLFAIAMREGIKVVPVAASGTAGHVVHIAGRYDSTHIGLFWRGAGYVLLVGTETGPPAVIRLASPDGRMEGASVASALPPIPSVGLPSMVIAPRSSGFVVVQADARNLLTSRLLDEAFQPITEPEPLPLPRHGPAETAPVVSVLGNDYLATWYQDLGGSFGLRLARIDRRGGPPRVTELASFSDPESQTLACTAAACLLIVPSHRSVWRITPEGVEETGHRLPDDVAFASNGTELLAVWPVERHDGDRPHTFTLAAGLVDASGRILSSFPVTSGIDVQHLEPRVVWHARTNQYLVAWQENEIFRAPPNNRRTARWRGVGVAMITPRGVMEQTFIAAATGSASLASNGEVAIVSWQEQSSRNAPVSRKLWTIETSLRESRTPITLDAAVQGTPRRFGKEFLFLEWMNENGNWRVEGIRVLVDGTIVDRDRQGAPRRWVLVGPPSAIFAGSDFAEVPEGVAIPYTRVVDDTMRAFVWIVPKPQHRRPATAR